MKLNKIYSIYVAGVSRLKGLSLLFLRLVLAYGFMNPAMRKLRDVGAIGDWFASMNYPMPYLNAYLATATEAAGVVLLALGLWTRLIVIPLQVVMIVAITTVHWSNGFAASDNGYEIPLYYLLMLFALMVFGSGRFSIDALMKRK